MHQSPTSFHPGSAIAWSIKLPETALACCECMAKMTLQQSLARSQKEHAIALFHPNPNLNNTLRNRRYHAPKQPWCLQQQPMAYLGQPQHQRPQTSYHTLKSRTGSYPPPSMVYPMQQIQQRPPIPPPLKSTTRTLPSKQKWYDVKLISVVVFFVFWILVSSTFLYMYMDKYLF